MPVVVQMAVLGAAGVVILVNLVALAVAVHRRRAMSRRLTVVLARLDLPGAAEESDRDDSMSRLERLAESAVLRVSEAEAAADRMSGALQELPQGVVICDEQGRVVYRNQAALALCEPDAEGGDAEAAITEALQAGVDGDHHTTSVELVGPPPRTLTVSGRPLDDGRRSLGAFVVVDDVSERRRFDAIRHDFVDNVTAELRTPLGALGLLATTIVAEDDAKLVRRLASRLRDDAVRVGRIVDDLAELSRIGSDVTPERQLVPVHLVVAQAVEEARSLSALRNVTIEAAEAPRRAVLAGNRRQLVSAVRRLVENAVTFSKEGSEVRVMVRRQAAFVEIAVTDQGPGIPGAELDRIFESFYRVAPNGSRDSAGTGLGLAIVSQVASAHGGEVQVSSTEEGSVFTLRLPVRSGTRQRRPRVRARQPELALSDVAG